MPHKSGSTFNIILLSVLFTLFLLISTVTTASESSNKHASNPAANLTYHGIYPNQAVHLKKGFWQGKPFQPGSASRPTVGLIKEFGFSGDLNQDGQAERIVFLWESSGGSGTQIYMAVLAWHNGHWTNMATTRIGDRLHLQMGRVNQGKIELDVIQAGETDAACCPTHHVLRSWQLKGNKLEESAPLALGQLSIKDLQGVNWQLVKLNWQESVADNSRISIRFADNKASGFSACNRFTTTVKTGKKAGEISFGPIAGTRKFCDPDIMELENRFLKALANVRSFGFINGSMTLEWQDDGAVSTMFFKAVR